MCGLILKTYFNNSSMKKLIYTPIMAIIVTVIVLSCKKTDKEIIVVTPPTTTFTVPAVYSKIYGATSVTSDGTFIIIKTTGVPDHKSAYYASNNSLYEAFSGTTFGGNSFVKNPNSISTQNITFKIPLNPQKATTSVATPLGPIGVAINGVALYNQYAGPNNQALTGEIASFDQFYGHPQNTGQYHYHVEPIYLTTVKVTKAALLGFLLDGFPVYGPEENGVNITNAMLDAYHGHISVTSDYPNGIYHYHINNTDPYINGSGFYGTAGTITR
jgi:hypothetical protein